jgi:hypothetical protein
LEDEVAAMLGEVMIRRLKSDVMEQLPPRGRQRVEVQLSKNATAAVRKLQNYGLDDEYFQELAMLKETAVQDYIDYLLEASSNKFLLFAHHRSMLDAIESFLMKRDVDFIRIDGRTSMEGRPGLVRRFQEQPTCRVAVLAILAAGEGLSFTAASLCVFCELCPAVPGVIEQAEGRIHRIGQKAAQVDAHYLIIQGTRDDIVFARLEARTGSVAQAIGDVPRVEADVDLDEPGHHDTIESAVQHKTFAMTDAERDEGFRRSPQPKKKRRKACDLGSLLDQAFADMGVVAKSGDVDVNESACKESTGLQDLWSSSSNTVRPGHDADSLVSTCEAADTHGEKLTNTGRYAEATTAFKTVPEVRVGATAAFKTVPEVRVAVDFEAKCIPDVKKSETDRSQWNDDAFSAMLGSLIDSARVQA